MRGAFLSFPAPGRRRLYHENTRVIYPHSPARFVRRVARPPSMTRRVGSARSSSRHVKSAVGATRKMENSRENRSLRGLGCARGESRSAPLGHRWNRRVTNRRFASTLGNRQLAGACVSRVTTAGWKPPGATSRAAHRTRPTRIALSRHAHVRPSPRRHARVRRARGRAARRASRVRQPVPARSVQAVSQEPPPAGSCGRSPRVFRRLHGPRDEPHVQALLQGACASTERAVGRSAPRAPAPAPARAVEKYPVSVPFDSAPHLGQTTDLASPAKATRAAVPDRARGEHRLARCSRRALHGGSARVRPPPVAHARPARAFPPYPPR